MPFINAPSQSANASVADLRAAEKMMHLQLAKYGKALAAEDWAGAHNALRALKEEAGHAQAFAHSLAFARFNQPTQRSAV